MSDNMAYVAKLEAIRAKLRRVKLPSLNELNDYFIRAVRKQTYLAKEHEAILKELVALETHLYQPPSGDLLQMYYSEGMAHESWLHRQEYFVADPDAQFARTTEAFTRIFALLTPPKDCGPSPFQVTLQVVQPSEFLYSLQKIIGESLPKYCLHSLSNTLRFNMPFDDERWWGLSAPKDDDAATHYLRNTPFQGMLSVTVPFPFTDDIRFNHTHIVGGTGAGKTTLLEAIILNDLKRKDRPALVIVDPHGDLIKKVSRLSIPDPILISPRDAPALNIFDVDASDDALAGVISTFDYLFTGLLGSELTTKQRTAFRSCTRLLLTLPQTMGRTATLLDFVKLLYDLAPYQPAIEALPDLQRTFFERDFVKAYSDTKEQILYRLRALLDNPVMERMFSAPKTAIDIAAELNKGSVILVDTDKGYLKDDSAFFGRFFISLVLQAVYSRIRTDRHPAYLIVDEAHQYFDQNIDDLLNEARKFNVGCIFAHQYLDQCTPELRASFAASTGIKCASGVSAGDARSLAPDMRTTPEFILNQPRLRFAAYVRGELPQAVTFPVTPGLMDKEPMLSGSAYEAFLARNRLRVTHERPSTPASPPSPLAKGSDEDVSEKW